MSNLQPPIDPSDYYVAAIRLTQEQGGDDYGRMLAAARACLNDFTLPLHQTDFKLMRRDEKAEFLECVQAAFIGSYQRHNVLILPAFPEHRLSTPLYWECYLDTLHTVIEAYQELHMRLVGTKRINSRTFNDAINASNRMMHFFKHDKLPQYTAFLRKAQQAKKTPKARAKTATLVGALVSKMQDDYDALVENGVTR